MPWLVAMTGRHAHCRVELERAGFEPYTPKIKEKKTVRGHRRWMIGYLFGRYFFVRHSDRWAEILNVRYVDDMIRYEDGSLPLVDDSEIATLRAREDRQGFIPMKGGFRLNQQVRAKSGLFMGSIGSFVGMAARDREIAVFEFMGQRTRIEFAPGILAAI